GRAGVSAEHLLALQDCESGTAGGGCLGPCPDLFLSAGTGVSSLCFCDSLGVHAVADHSCRGSAYGGVQWDVSADPDAGISVQPGAKCDLLPVYLCAGDPAFPAADDLYMA